MNDNYEHLDGVDSNQPPQKKEFDENDLYKKFNINLRDAIQTHLLETLQKQELQRQNRTDVIDSLFMQYTQKNHCRESNKFKECGVIKTEPDVEITEKKETQSWFPLKIKSTKESVSKKNEEITQNSKFILKHHEAMKKKKQLSEYKKSISAEHSDKSGIEK